MSKPQMTLGDVADLLGAELHGDAGTGVSGIATLQNAEEGDVSFLSNSRYQRYLQQTGATAVLITRELVEECPVNALVLDDPYLGFALLSHHFDPEPRPGAGVHSSAVVAEDAEISPSAWIGPNAVIERSARIGDNVRVGSGSVVGARSQIGEDSVLAANVSVYHDVRIGARCRISSGAAIGSDGFGYAHAGTHWERIAQIGGVWIGDDVDVGANTCIDRGALDDTVVGNGVKLDNMIQISHNVVIGENTIMAGHAGVAGSTHVGRNCVFGGAAAVSGHLEIADNVHLTGMAMVTRSLKEPGVYSSGTGVEPNRDWRRSVVRFRQLDDMAQRLKALEKKLSE